MCGIAGFVELRPERDGPALDAIGREMGSRIAHRGPDDSGVWSDPTAGLCLSHRRLSIVDLSPAGHQPMTSMDGRHVMVFNGEIYNHKALRRELEARFGIIAWRGSSDTEVLLEWIARVGLQETLSRAAGMFALAIWDRAERRLVLARDRAGEKPLYYGRAGSTFLFGSELKALQAHPDWRGELNLGAVSNYLRFSYVPEPHSIYRGIYKLEAGHYISADLRELSEPQSIAYWRYPLPTSSREAPPGALDELEATLQRAIGRQLEADVPVGCFLSGGIDSSLVTALAQTTSARAVRTYSIGFDEPELNEAPFAAAIARHLHTDHTELYIDGRAAIEVVPQLSQVYDEPFADSSQIPTLLLSRLTRRHVTVALSGDAGDELFGGYGHYARLGQVQWVYDAIPTSVRRTAAFALTGAAGRAAVGAAQRLGLSSQFSKNRLLWLRTFLPLTSGYEAYLYRRSTFPRPEAIAPTIMEGWNKLADPDYRRQVSDLAPWAAYMDAQTYLPDDILVKVDRASMSTSLEVRVPMLDPEVIECAARFPWESKHRGGVGKWPLRDILRRHVPAELFERPKRGFGVPLATWLRGDLRDWGAALLTPGTGLLTGLLDAPTVERLWQDHVEERQDNASRLWVLLMLQQWAVENGVSA